MAAVRYTGNNEALPPDGSRSENWGAATAGTIATGPAFLLNVRRTVEEQAEWLARVNPGYVLAYPSVLPAIAELRVLDLSSDERRQMLELMDRHYENVQPAAFDADLSEKQWVIQVVHPETGELCGFSTQMLLEVVVDDRPIRALFSGDTIIDRRYWGDQALSHLWGQFTLSPMAGSSWGLHADNQAGGGLENGQPGTAFNGGMLAIPVPEPSGVLLLLFGAAALYLAKRHSQRQPTSI